MKDKARQGFVKQITEIIRHARSAESDFGKRLLIISRSAGGFQLHGEYVDKYEQLVARLLDEEGWTVKFSEKFVSNRIADLIAETLASGDEAIIGTLFNDLVSEFQNFADEYTVYFPLTGIQLSNNEYTIGNITLITVNDELLRHILETNERVVLSTIHTSEEKQSIIASNRNFLMALQGKVCSRYQVVAEPARAKERAEEETRRVIDLLRYATPAIYDKELRVMVGLDYEVFARTTRMVPVIANTERRFNIQFENIGSFQDFEINVKTIKRMSEIGITEVSEILQKSRVNITDFENAILRGIHWLSASTVQTERENSFLNLITCLETYLTPRDNNPIGTAIAEGAAIILADDLVSRKSIKRRIKDYYGKRSGIAHGGEKSILEQDLSDLLEIAGQLTIWMILHRREFSSIKKLLEWVEDKKLS